MKINRMANTALLLMAALSAFLFAETNEIEEDPLAALRWFYEMRKDADGNYSEGKRWEAYQNMRKQTLNKTGFMPVANWRSIGPNTTDSLTGRMISHAIDPVDNQIIWAGSANGGLWKSTNGGDSWLPVADDIPTLEISEVAINPKNRNEMLVGTGVDRVQTFTLKPGIGVLRSADRGLTWSLTSFSYNVSQSISVSSIIWHPSDETIVYMAASNGFWKSEDGGQNWTLKRSGRNADIEINVNDPDVIYALFRQDGIYKSEDGGESWAKQTNGLPSGSVIGLGDITICDSMPEVLYTSISNSDSWALEGFYKTENGGQSWTKITNAPNVTCQPGNSTSCIGWFVNECAVSPVDPDLVFLGGVQMWRSDDGGKSWTWHDYLSNGTGYDNSGLVYVDQWDIGFDPFEPETVYIFNDGGIQKSYNSGKTWLKKSDDLVTAHVYRIASALTDTNIVIGGFQDHGLQVLDNSNGNTTWNRWTTNDGTQVIVDPTNEDVFYGSFFFGSHYKNAFGGANWLFTTVSINSGITEGGVQFAPLVLDEQNPEVLYTASVSKIYKTTNRGSLWKSVAAIPNVHTLAIDQVNSSIIYAHSYTGNNWSIWRSENAGENWNQINHNTIPTWRVVDLESDPSHEGTLYAVRNSAFANSDHIKKSVDYGETWVDITSNLPDINTNAIAISPYSPDHLYLATDLGVFVSVDGGKEWNEYNDGLPLTYVSDIHYHPVDRTVRISTLGRGVYKTKAIDYGVTTVEDEKQAVVNDFKVFANYPNPFNPDTKISFALLKPGAVKIDIYNRLGQRIRQFRESRYEKGRHHVLWNGTNDFGNEVPSGTYYARIIFGNSAKTIKMLLLK